MTREEAIEVFNELKKCYLGGIVDAIDMAIEALKTQEPIEARLNLCESCAKEYAECEADKTDLAYGSGVGNDNIIGCPWYVNRWKVQEPRVMTLEEWKNLPEPKDGECLCYEINDGSRLQAMLIKAFAGSVHLYGKAFRCWTSRPTDEQREAIPWN